MPKLKPWYNVVVPREDLREHRPLDASEFAVHWDHIRHGRAHEDYVKPDRFFGRTYLTRSFLALARVACFAAVLASTSFTPHVSAQDSTIIFVHGVGGPYEKCQFRDAMLGLFEGLGYHCGFEYYQWRSDTHQWNEAKALADRHGIVLLNDLILNLERRRQPYFLTAHSLGTQVVMNALASSPARLESLQAVYFMNAALPKIATLPNRGMLPHVDGQPLKIVSFSSPFMDNVLRAVWYAAEVEDAGGEVGFDDQTLFDNRGIQLTHGNYWRMADAIGFLCLYRRNVFVRGPRDGVANLAHNLQQNDVLKWSEIKAYGGVPTHLAPISLPPGHAEVGVFQYYKEPGSYRTLWALPDGTRFWERESNNPHLLFHGLGMFPTRFVDSSGAPRYRDQLPRAAPPNR
ncbi:MAG: hypothetical protein ABIP48_26215 [Planctomycetota bacterium]